MLNKTEINPKTGCKWFENCFVEREENHLVKDFTGSILFGSEVF